MQESALLLKLVFRGLVLSGLGDNLYQILSDIHVLDVIFRKLQNVFR